MAMREPRGQGQQRVMIADRKPYGLDYYSTRSEHAANAFVTKPRETVCPGQRIGPRADYGNSSRGVPLQAKRAPLELELH